jgi:3-deoxy-D-manno-octulosonate 8-phosphate phosphatase (KDO 8-P phosphatase)
MPASPFHNDRSQAEQARLLRIRFLLTDVDGVLTDGQLQLDGQGNETKVFHVHDSAGFAYWHRSGFGSGLLSGRESSAALHHGRSMGIEEIHLGHRDKLPVVEEIARRNSLDLDEIAYIGDDLLDLPVLRAVGLAASVPGGRPEVLAVVQYVTRTAGGRGAVRELVEEILRAKGMWDRVISGDGLK